MKSIGVVGKAFTHVGTKMESAASEYKTKSAATGTKRSKYTDIPSAAPTTYGEQPGAAPTYQEQARPAPVDVHNESLTRSLIGSTERAQKYGAC